MMQAILAKAFRSELVPTEAALARADSRDYEPASVLLAQIRSINAMEPSDRHRAGGGQGTHSRRRRV
jgi:hypothetical protein